MDEDIFAAAVLLDEAEALLAIEELDRSLASADDLCRHAIETAASGSAASARSAATASGAAPAATAEAITATGAAIFTKSTATTTESILLPKIVAWGEIIAATEGIEAVFAESVALVPAPAAPSIVTHNLIRTLSLRPNKLTSIPWTEDGIVARQASRHKCRNPYLNACNIAHKALRGE